MAISYAKRNNLTIIGVLILLSLIGFFWYRSEAKVLDKARGTNIELRRALEEDREVSDTYGLFKLERDSLEKKLEFASKKLIHAQEPTFSLSYINWLIENYGLNLDFDFYLMERKEGKRFTTLVYSLNGEGDYENFCLLIWYLTNNPILYNIRDANLRRSEKNPELLHFSLTLEGYSVSDAWEGAQDLSMISTRVDFASEFGYDIFANGRRRLVSKAKKPDAEAEAARRRAIENAGLINVQKASLVAIAGDRVYLRDKSSGKVVALNIGDRVRDGVLMAVDQKANRATFELRNGESRRLVYLNLEFN